MKLTRRQLVVAVAGSVIAGKAMAQGGAGAPSGNAAAHPAPSPSSAPVVSPDVTPDFGKQARDSVQQNRETLANFVIPMSTEPAFQFKA